MAKAPAAKKPQNILLATDLTAAADRAFDRAVQLAKEWGSALTLCHVVEASSVRPIGIERRIRNVDMEMAELEKKWAEQNAKIMREHPADAPPEMEPTGAYPARPVQPEVPSAAAEAKVAAPEGSASVGDAPAPGGKPEA